MGHQATVVMRMDTIHLIKDDPQFGRKLYDACVRHTGQSTPTSIIGGEGVVVSVHHCDYYQVILSGGGSAVTTKSCVEFQHDENAMKLNALKQFADELGYRVSKKSREKLPYKPDPRPNSPQEAEELGLV